MTGIIIVLSIVALLLIVLAWILTAPLVIVIDTLAKDYRAELRSIGGVWLLPEEDWKVRFRLLFYHKDFFLLRPRKKRAEPKKEPPEKKRKRKSWFRMSRRALFRKAKNVLKTFRVRHCRIDLDTDDYVMNAQLYPLFAGIKGLTGNRLNTTINFRGEVQVQVKVVNRLGRVAWAALW